MSTPPIDRSAPNRPITEARPPSPKLAAVSPRGIGAVNSSLSPTPHEEQYINNSSKSPLNRDTSVSNNFRSPIKSVALLQSVLNSNGGHYTKINQNPPPIEDVKKAILSEEYTLNDAILTGKITACDAIQHGLAK
jgi:hypothetical protein